MAGRTGEAEAGGPASASPVLPAMAGGTLDFQPPSNRERGQLSARTARERKREESYLPSPVLPNFLLWIVI